MMFPKLLMSQALMVPYTSFLLPTFEVHLRSLPHAADEESPALWISLITTLTKSLSNDDGGMSVLFSTLYSTLKILF